jgi:hypothetical protein
MSFSPPFSDAGEGTTVAIIVGVIVGVVLLIVLVLCWCRLRGRGQYDSRLATVHTRTVSSRDDLDSDLIPPVFYTPDMRDPLLQEDLTDHVHRSSRSIYV